MHINSEYRMNKNQQWHRKTALQSLKTITVNVLYNDRVDDNHFTMMIYIPTPSIRTPILGVMIFIILVDPSLVIIIIYLICLNHIPVYTRRGEILHFHYMVMSKHKNPCHGCHEIYNFGRTFLDHHCCALNLLNLAPEQRRRFLKETMHFLYVTYNLRNIRIFTI